MQVNVNTEEALKENREQQDNTEAIESKILGKFNSYEDLEKAYQELEKKLGGNKKVEETAVEEKGVAEEKAEDKEAPDTNVEKSAGLTKVVEDYIKTGKLDEKALEEFGLTPQHLEIYKKGIEAEIKEAEGKLYEAAGGIEEYNAILSWAAQALSKEDIEAYNAELSSGDLRKATMAVKALKADYLTYSKETRRINNTALPKHSSDTYKSDLEIQRDMKDPRYYSDKAFRAEVEEKMVRSYKLGTVSKERGKAGWRISK